MDFFVGVLSICLLFLFIRTSIQNYRLQNRLTMVELSQTAQRDELDQIKADNLLLSKDQEQWVKNNRSEFDKRLSDELNKACEKIKFNEIEYKKTITKKRKEYNRKNSANAKPQRQHRYIDEDNSPSMQ